MSTSHPVDSSHITQGAGIPDDALNAMIGATVPTEGGTDCDDALSGMCRCVRESGHAGNHRCLCAVDDLSDGAATMPSMNTTTNPIPVPIPAGATSVGEWDGGSRYFCSSHREVAAQWMTLTVALDGEQQQTGEVRRFIVLSSDTGHGPTDIADGPLSIDEARQYAAALIAAADEADEMAKT